MDYNRCYWLFLVFNSARTFVGLCNEMHLSFFYFWQDSDDEQTVTFSTDIPMVESSSMEALHEVIAEIPALYEGSTWTLFETLVKLFDWFSSHPSLSKEAFTRNLQLWKSLLPKGCSLPNSYKEAYSIIKPYLVPEVIFHACVNDCIVFRGEYENNLICPKCYQPRFKAGKPNIPQRTFHYLPLGPRLTRSLVQKTYLTCYRVTEVNASLQQRKA